MSNEKLARQWAEYYKDDWPKFTPGTRAAELVEKAKAAAEYILATTTPLTMADVKWDDKKHCLAGATCNIDESERVILVPRNGMIVNAKLGRDRVLLTSPGSLTPNGKRYELREVADEPDAPTHPATQIMEAALALRDLEEQQND